ncbi:MAG: response regulator transcription factor [bacterium]|nr:response regulator transcription factor [bacterium]
MRILVVEDDKRIAGFVQKGLKEEQHAVDAVYNGEDGEFWAEVNEYDLIILDVMLPKKNGIDVCHSLRKKKVNTPIIMLTARDTLEDKITGLDSGADDYLCKPFSFEELLARCRALLRRTQSFKTRTLNVADLELDPASRKVFRDGREITLSGKEYALLEYLLRNKGIVISETKIVEHVWDMNYDPMTNVVNVYIHHLRKKIDTGFKQKILHTVRNSGYVIKEPEPGEN